MASINEKGFICGNISLDASGELCFAGQNIADLAARYGTPLYLMDEDRIRERMRTYKTALYEAFGSKGKILYASKAASFKRIYEIAKDEGIGADVVSSGEIITAMAADFPMDKVFFHSNNKTDDDIVYAIDCGVERFVVDNEEELFAINAIAEKKQKVQSILLRITPGIDPHTYAAVATGQVDSKFGSAIETMQADEIVGKALKLKNIKLCGFHCHVGSQVFDSEVYMRAAKVMLTFISDMKKKYGFITEELNLGGGYGVRYTDSDPTIDIAENICEVGKFVRRTAEELDVDMPDIMLEPGRSIVADAGVTVYTVGTVKRIPGYKNYVSVDGGMTDNPRYALYGSKYTFLPCRKMNEPFEMSVSVVGRCCESGDMLGENVALPESMCRGDIIVCLTTGAYNYSMSSNYNRIPRPAVVMLSEGKAYVAVRRETPEDIIRYDV